MRILLKGLTPATSYALSIRAGTSPDAPWSPVGTLTTTNDLSAPLAPANLSWISSGDSFISRWDKVTLDSDGSPLRDFKDYQVTISNGSGTSRTYTTTSESFDFTREMNVELFGSLATTLTIAVRSRDRVNNQSGATSLTLNAGTPPKPATPTISKYLGSLVVEWSGKTSGNTAMPLDFNYVEVHVSTTDGFSPSATTLNTKIFGDAKQQAVITGLGYGSTYYVKLVAFNRLGKASTPSDQASGTPSRITNLDIQNGSITTDQINFVDQLGGGKAFYQTSFPTSGMAEGDTFFDTDDGYHVYVYSNGQWRDARDSTIVTANNNASSALTAANGKNRNYYQTSQPTGGTYAVGDTWFDTDDGYKIYNYDGSVWLPTAFGTNAILNSAITGLKLADGSVANAKIANIDAGKITSGSIDANRIAATSITATHLATDAVTAIKIKAGAITADKVGANLIITSSANIGSAVIDDANIANLNAAKIRTGELAAGVRIIAGPENDTHAEMTSTGFRVYGRQPDTIDPATGNTVTGQVTEVVRLGTDNNDFFAVTQADGSYAATIDDSGRASFDDLIVDKSPTFGGRTLDSIIERLPKGVVAWGQFQANQNNVNTEIGLFEVAFNALPNRMYRTYITNTQWGHSSNTAGQNVLYLLRATSPSSPNTWAELQRFNKYLEQGAGNFNHGDNMISHIWASPEPGLHRMVLSVYSANSGMHAYGLQNLVVEDLGPTPPNVAVAQTLGGSPNNPPPQPVVQTYTKQYGTTWSQSYKGDNSIMSNANGLLYQGYESYNGNTRSLVGWNAGPVMSDLAGATVNNVQFFLYAAHWYNNSGGTAVLGAHGLNGPPGSYAGLIDPGRFQSGGWPKPGGRWLDITAWGNEIKAGSVRGIAIGYAPNNDRGYYGYFHGHTYTSGTPTLQITFTK